MFQINLKGFLFFSIAFLFLALSEVNSQIFPSDKIPGNHLSYKPPYHSNYPDWAQLLYEPDLNYHELIAAYNNREKSLDDLFKAIHRYFNIWNKKVQPWIQEDGQIATPQLSAYYENVEAQRPTLSKQLQKEFGDSDWTFLGPKETFWLNEANQPDPPLACPWQVNIYSFDVSTSNPNVIYAGTETGFVNKSIDNGLTWELLAKDYNFGGGVTAVLCHPENENIVYAAAGYQVHKTTDGGISWESLLDNEPFYADNLELLAEDPDKIYAASADGLFQTNDAGSTWVQVWNAPVTDVIILPNNPLAVYAITNDVGKYGIVHSTDGINFQLDATFPDHVYSGGGLVAVSPDEPSALFVAFLSENNDPHIYKKTDQWNLLAVGNSNSLGLDNGQGFYDFAFEVSPLDSDIIFVGTTTLFKSNDGGNNFIPIGGYTGDFPIHPDIQDMKILPSGDSWLATDGGFTYSTDYFGELENADARNRMLVGSDMWGFDQGWNEDIVVGGRYHNGNTAITDFYGDKALRMGGAESPTGWVLQGKSRHVAFDDLGNGWILPKTAEGQPEGRFIFSKHPNMDEYGGRRGNLIIHPNYFGRILLGEGDGFWRSNDNGESFDLLHDFGSRIRFVQVSQSNPEIVYADVVNQGLFRSDDGGQTWEQKTSITSNINGGSYYAGKMFIAVSPTDENKVYVCLNNGTWTQDQGSIFYSEDGGNSWIDWTNELNVLTKSLVVQPDENGEDLIYLFSNAGEGFDSKVFIRNAESSWEEWSSGFPAGFQVNTAKAFYRDGKLRVAGNGGVWETPLAVTDFKTQVNFWAEKQMYDCMLDTVYLDDHSIVNHEDVEWDWLIQPTPAYAEGTDSRNAKFVPGEEGSYSVSMILTQNGEGQAKTINEMITVTTCPSLADCSNPDYIPTNQWTLIDYSSQEEIYPGYVTMAYDNDPSTIWHTTWSTSTPEHPHWLEIDLNNSYDIFEFELLNRQDGVNGRIADYELYVSDTADSWGEALLTGTFENTAGPQKIKFDTPVTGRYFRLVALSEVNDGPWASIAELRVKACYTNLASTQALESNKDLFIYPTPSDGLLQVSTPTKGIFHFEVFSMQGKQVLIGTMDSDLSTSLDLSTLSTGQYVIVLTDRHSGVTYRSKCQVY